LKLKVEIALIEIHSPFQACWMQIFCKQQSHIKRERRCYRANCTVKTEKTQTDDQAGLPHHQMAKAKLN
jgi:hypothetical protein